MRTITDHFDGHGLADSISITADEQDLNAEGASHAYVVRDKDGKLIAAVSFQHGPRDEVGSTSGITDGVLLAIIVDRMRVVQRGAVQHPRERPSDDQVPGGFVLVASPRRPAGGPRGPWQSH